MCCLNSPRSLAHKRVSRSGDYIDVSEARHAPYVHDQHRPDHGVYVDCWRCAISGADRVIKWSTAFAVLGVAPVPALARWLLGLGIAATLAANVARGLGHGVSAAAVAAWPAVALVGWARWWHC
jgi:hypothetical protein